MKVPRTAEQSSGRCSDKEVTVFAYRCKTTGPGSTVLSCLVLSVKNQHDAPDVRVLTRRI